ncbi:MAG: peptidyl-dipeptidase Dcp [Bacteroidia bacterium]|nr:peptidyl-dipeptidase Dcp [Bacteroidia bacterium]MCZ2277434.1 peptidyl-dipeptidase Dcp [Bacteroidia bacterium]
MNRYSAIPMLAVLVITVSCNDKKQAKQSAAISADNPFLKQSTLPFQAPDFTKIKDSDFLPAFEEGIRQQKLEVDSIADNPQSPTFENTLVALEKSGRILARVQGVFSLISGANTNDQLQKTEEAVAPMLAAQRDAIFLNKQLFNRVRTIYNNRSSLNLDAESLRLTEYYYQQFQMAGAELSDEGIAVMKKLNEEEASLMTQFSNKLLDAAKAGVYVTDNKENLSGLSEGDLETAAKDADQAGKKGKWQISLQNTTQQPVLSSLTNREVRQQIFNNSWNRAEKNDSNDTRKDIIRMAELRAQKAKLLGFNSYAEWKLQDQMAKTPKAVDELFAHLLPAIEKVKSEAAELQQLIEESGTDFQLEAWDWNYFAEKLRKAKYDLNEEEIKPYFEINTVLEKGVFYAANKLYGITFKEQHDLPVYHEDVRVFIVLDQDGSQIGLFYCDFFKRDNKSGGAWMSNIVEQSHLLETKPVIYNVCNFTKPAEGQPALISFDDVTTMFHEFGHALHGLFADQKYPSLSGTNTARDFVEFPSQFNEHWAIDPDILKNYAIHYQSGEGIPEELIEKIRKAASFNQGYLLSELVTAAVLDMQWHTIPEGETIKDADQFEQEALTRTNWYLKTVPPRYRSSYFLHIWGNGYAAGYYAYLWTEMLDHDAYEWFMAHGGMTAENGQRFRDMILSKGNTIEYATMYRNFTGRNPKITPMLKNRGLL